MASSANATCVPAVGMALTFTLAPDANAESFKQFMYTILLGLNGICDPGSPSGPWASISSEVGGSSYVPIKTR